MKLNVNLHHLKLFYYVAKYGGVTKAAGKMPERVERSTISKQLSQLEKELGFALLKRQPFQVGRAGARVFAFIKPLFEEFPHLVEELRRGPNHLVRMGASPVVLREYVPAMKTVITTKPTGTSVDVIRAAAADIGALREEMTFLLPLTDAERREHRAARIGMKTLRSIENRLAAARQHRELLPPAFDLRKFERDATTASALGECLAAIDQMRAEVYDTLLAVGQRALVAATSAYGHIKVGSTTAESLKRTVEKLATRPGRTPAAEKPTLPSVLPAPTTPGTPPPAAPAAVPASPPQPAPAAKADSTTEPTNQAA